MAAPSNLLRMRLRPQLALVLVLLAVVRIVQVLLALVLLVRLRLLLTKPSAPQALSQELSDGPSQVLIRLKATLSQALRRL